MLRRFYYDLHLNRYKASVMRALGELFSDNVSDESFDWLAEAAFYELKYEQLVAKQAAEKEANELKNNPGHAWRSGNPGQIANSGRGGMYLQLYPRNDFGAQADPPKNNNRWNKGLVTKFR